MSAPTRPVPPSGRMTADEFLAWAAEQPSGRYELYDGQVEAMAPERVEHARVKGEAFAALRQAIRFAGLPCQALTDGPAVRVDESKVFEPDASVHCGPRPPIGAMEVPDPIIVVEVISPSSERKDVVRKLAGYFAVPSIRHYLILDPDIRMIIHYHREPDDRIEVSLVPGTPEAGAGLILDPPGLTLLAADLFEAP